MTDTLDEQHQAAKQALDRAEQAYLRAKADLERIERQMAQKYTNGETRTERNLGKWLGL